MKKWLTALPVLSLLLFSCQKEIGFDSPTDPGNGGGTGALLVKVVAVTGSDKLTTVYTYDNQKRMETMITDGSSGGILLHNYRKLVYDAAGRVSQVIQYLEQNGIASDTAVNKIHYPNATTMEYDYSVNPIGLMGFTTTDSSVYNFSGGKLQNVTSYLSSPLLGPDPFMSSKFEFSYDGAGRVSLMKMYSVTTPGDPLEHIANESFTYTSSLNAEWLPTNAAQAYWVGGFPNASNDAVATFKFESMEPSVPSFTATMSYVVGAGNKPTASTYTSTDGQITKYTYFYQ